MIFSFILVLLINISIYLFHACDSIYLRIFSDLLTRQESAGEVEGQIAALTTDFRNQWCLNRRRFFLENATNRASLAAIESANFYLVLDDTDYSDNPVSLHALQTLFITVACIMYLFPFRL